VALDITADGQFLYVAEAQAGATESYVREVDLSDNSVRNIPYGTQGLPDGTFDVNVTANGKVFFTGDFAGSGGSAIRQYDPVTDLVTTVTGVPQRTRLKSNEDGSYFAIGQGNISSGPLSYYEASTDSFPGSVGTGGFMDRANFDINADGSIVAVEIFQDGLQLRDPTNNFAIIAENTTNFDAGIAFDPLRPLVYVGDSQNDELVAFNVPTLTEAFRIPLGVNAGRSYRPLTVSGEGDRVFINGAADEIVMFETIVPTTRSVTIAGADVNNVDFGHRDLPNQSPVAADDDYSLGAGATINIDAADGVLANDVDPNFGQAPSRLRL